LPVRSPLLGQSLLFSLPEITEMFQFTSLPSVTYEFSHGYPIKDELSHSETLGSKCVCHSPRLIAAYHVLRRQPMPRHPPYTFIHFIQYNTSRRNYVLHFQDKYVKELLKKSFGIDVINHVFTKILFFLELTGIEPATSCLQSRRSPN
jgi:hypothetical protein